MQSRTSKKVTFVTNFPETNSDVIVPLNAYLFEWVIENLCKNAIDAMDGKGSITIEVKTENGKGKVENLYIDITDTGKGIDRRNFKRIFQPGYTSKKRGWGLGLSLGKRIIEDYHRGKLFVKQSQMGVGTTFRVVLCSGVGGKEAKHG